MALQGFNAEAGITVGSTPISVIDANGNVSLTGANVSLGDVSNLHITGGSSGYFLQTNGSGNLTWVLGSNGISNGNSSIAIATSGGNISFSANGTQIANLFYGTDGGFEVVTYGNPDLIVGSLGNTDNAGGSLVFKNYAGPNPANTISTKINNYVSNTATGNTVFDLTGVYNGNGDYARSMMRYDHGTNQWDFFANNAIQLVIAPNAVTVNNQLTVNDITGDEFTANSLTITSGNTASIAANGLITGATFTSTVATGTAPFKVASTTVVANLNADTAAVASTISLTGPNANVTNYRFIMSQGTASQTPVSIQAGQMNYNANTQQFTFGAETNFNADNYWNSGCYFLANDANANAYASFQPNSTVQTSLFELLCPIAFTDPAKPVSSFEIEFVPGVTDKLVFSYEGSNVMSLDAVGNLVLVGTLTQNGTP